MGEREMNYIWTPRLQSAGHCCTAAFLDNDTVQRWRPGITSLPAASQELQLLLLTGCSLGTDALLDTAGPWWLLWPSGRPGQVQQHPESWNSLLRGIKRKSFPLCLKLMLQINPCHPTEGQLQKRAWSDPNYGISLPCTALTSSVDRPGKLAGPRHPGAGTVQYSPSGSGRVQARSSKAVGGVYVKACRQHVLITKQGHYAILLS